MDKKDIKRRLIKGEKETKGSVNEEKWKAKGEGKKGK